MFKFFAKSGGETVYEETRSIVQKVNALENEFSKLKDGELREKTEDFKKRIGGGESLDDILPEAFATVREAAKRTLEERHFDVQVAGGVVLHLGNISEMKTGEGKTLVATLPAYLNALKGGGVHIVTVNDYLSRRDTVWMGQIYDFLGISVGVINHEASFLYDSRHTTKTEDKKRDETGAFHIEHEFLRPVSRREAYLADITYGTNSEFGFDYLRDNLEYGSDKLRQREHTYAIVDEIDSILIDEARTPLIISAPTGDSEKLYGTFAHIAKNMVQGTDFTVDEKQRAIQMVDLGIEKAERALGLGNIYTDKGIKYVHHLETAVRAEALYKRDKHYVVKDGEVIIVDEFTGRLQPGRRWSEGLHQAIEAKEGVAVKEESRTFASITYQNYFRMYEKLAGMTGTAATSREEFYKVYGLETVVVPPNKPITRADLNDLIFRTEKGKFRAVARKIKELYKKGQPVLVGTVSIEKNELLAEFLKQEGVPHVMLNAKNHEKEGEIIAQAGRKGAVTVATNMAGRGVDIKLGGNPNTAELHREVKSLQGLFVLGTERHEARRIDNQLRGRSGRQGDPGTTQFFVSLEDDLMRVFASDTVKNMMGRLGIPEDEPIENKMITKSLEKAQEKIEGLHFDARKHVLEFDDVLNHQRKTIYERRRKILVGGKDAVDEYLEKVYGEESEHYALIKKTVMEKIGDQHFYTNARLLILQTQDLFWVDHLEAMEYARGSVNLRAYGQRDPLVEYKKEGLRMYKEMEIAIEEEVKRLLPHLGIAAAPVEKVNLEVNVSDAVKGMLNESAPTKSISSEFAGVGRNDPCPCGAKHPDGRPKKFKHCHGK
ncbi:MAG TPA: preprotein translocase subunit SecA [Candidatus Paceibacterota bacterium]